MKKIPAINIFASCLASIACGFIASPQAADLSLHPTPLYLGGLADPNIIFTLDDSGSMQWEFMPDDLRSICGEYLFPPPSDLYSAGNYDYEIPNFRDDNVFNFYCRSTENNKIFYNPDVTYKPWLDSNGDPYVNQATNGDAVATTAFYNPADSTKGTLDLTAEVTETAAWRGFYTDGTDPLTASALCDDDDDDDDDNCVASSHTYWPITYYNYAGTGNAASRASYTRIQITTSTAATATFTSPGGIIRTRDEEIQNFANWFQYFRSRIHAARAGVGRAFSQQNINMRVGFGAINKSAEDIDGVSTSTMIRGVRRFSGADRSDFFDLLYERPIDGGTPLRRALDDVGQYVERSDNQGPWGNTPGSNDSTTQLSCRQNYNILMTDGYWNSEGASTSAAQANVDNSTGSSITHSDGSTTYQYTPAAPYQDAVGNTLADVSMYYWYRDLRTNLVNDIPTNSADPAFWQHLVSFTVGLGVDGTLDPLTDWTGLQAGTASWPSPFDSDGNSKESAENIDDLWHTAVNSRGNFFSASDPDTFAAALSDTLATISERESSSAAAIADSGSISDDSRLFQAGFDSGDWSGTLKGFDIASNGSVDTEAPVWNTAASGSAFDTQTYLTRRIVTYKPSTGAGITFQWPADPASPASGELDASQISVLNNDPDNPGTDDSLGQSRLEYLRGRSVSGFRTRTNKLGDIVNSSPAYVGRPRFRYPRDWDDLMTVANDTTPEDGASIDYAQFRENKASRTPMLYVGANDGMLHAFESDDGQESFAYIPGSVFENLNQLTSPDYSHKYFVDGSPSVVDAFFGGAWHTVLAGGLRAGGQGVYALDVTDVPSSATNEASISSKVLWEFSDANDQDLGYTFSEPNIVRMHDGKWYAVFGNGYNNTEDDSSGNCGDSGSTKSCSGNAVLYIVNLQTGDTVANPMIKIDTGVGLDDHPNYSDGDATTDPTPNGLSTPAPVDIDGDFIVDYIYAGDLYGNLWKFDVTSSTTSEWNASYVDANNDPRPLFSAIDPATTPDTLHPITVRPQIGKHPTGKPADVGVLVYFGTGKYFETGDDETTGTPTETFYAIWDRNQSASGQPTSDVFTRSHFLEQQIAREVAQGFDTNGDGSNDVTYTLRVSSDNPIAWHSSLTGLPSGGTTHLGWYMDLVNNDNSNTDGKGEKLVFDPVLRNGRIIFVTLLPSSDSCVGGGDGWVMVLDAEDGGRLSFAPYDFNGDDKFNQSDYVDSGVTDANGDPIMVPSGGVKFDEINTRPSILSKPNSDIELQYFSDSNNEINSLTANKGPREEGRQSWWQFR